MGEDQLSRHMLSSRTVEVWLECVRLLAAQEKRIGQSSERVVRKSDPVEGGKT